MAEFMDVEANETMEEEVNVSLYQRNEVEEAPNPGRREAMQEKIAELVKECQSAQTIIDVYEAKPAIRMELEKINAAIDLKSPYQLSNILEDCVKDWKGLSDQHNMKIEGRVQFECDLVRKMNEWVGLVTLNGKDPEVVIRVPGMFIAKNNRVN